MKLIVGLGNPGTRYQETRHNIGFAVVELLGRRWGVDLTREKFRARFGDGEFAGQRVALLEPMTYMNLSGESVAAAVGFYKPAREDLLVVSDDMDLPLGRLRLRADGASGGHKGLADIERRLGTQEYHRLRFGIGRNEDETDSVDWVLSRFAEGDGQLVEETTLRAAEAVECWIGLGIDEAMTRFNRAP